MKILIHTYRGTSSVGQAWWKTLDRLLAYNKLKVLDVSSIAGVQNNNESLDRAFSELPDALFLYWRWPFRDNEEKQAAYMRQQELLDFAVGAKIPVLIYDGDLQPGVMDCADNLRRLGCQTFVCAPMFNPPKGYRRLFYPITYVGPKMKNYGQLTKTTDFVYVGNDYRRYRQMMTYLSDYEFRNMINHIWGNWLDKHDEDKLKLDFPYIKFMGRAEQAQVPQILSSAMFTCHFAPPEYCETGMMTMRWQEAASAGLYAEVPEEFQMPDNLRRLFSVDPRSLYSDRIRYNIAVSRQYGTIFGLCDHVNWTDTLGALLSI